MIYCLNLHSILLFMISYAICSAYCTLHHNPYWKFVMSERCSLHTEMSILLVVKLVFTVIYPR